MLSFGPNSKHASASSVHACQLSKDLSENSSLRFSPLQEEDQHATPTRLILSIRRDPLHGKILQRAQEMRQEAALMTRAARRELLVSQKLLMFRSLHWIVTPKGEQQLRVKCLERVTEVEVRLFYFIFFVTFCVCVCVCVFYLCEKVLKRISLLYYRRNRMIF